MKNLDRAKAAFERGDPVSLCRVCDGFDAFLAADLTKALAKKAEGASAAAVHVARDAARARAFIEAVTFAAPDIEVLEFPAWDCQPYDRVSPSSAVTARRMTTLARLAGAGGSLERPRLVATTVNALVQRTPPVAKVATDAFSAAPGNMVKIADLAQWLETNGFTRTSIVREAGDYATRGGILDLFAPSMPAPVRLDFFGDSLESIRAFDIESQRTTASLRAIDLTPVGEATMTSESIRRFRQNYVAEFGAQTRDDALYEAVSEGRRFNGMEHWLPLFFPKMDTLFDYLGGAALLLDPLAEEACAERLSQARDYYQNRRENFEADPIGANYKPLKPEALYLTPEELSAQFNKRPLGRFSPFLSPDSQGEAVIDFAAEPARNFTAERADETVNVFEATVRHIDDLRALKKKIIVAGWTDGSRERLASVLQEHGLKQIEFVASLNGARLAKGVAIATLPLEHGFTVGDLAVLGEQDILGDRLARGRKARKRADDALREVGALSAGDLVVHVDHGIGRFVRLTQVTAIGAAHDCLELHYAGGDKLYLPVENLELLSRYGSEDQAATLDKLGGAGWQNRKARLKKRIREIAHGLIKLAAQRMVLSAPAITPPPGAYEEFCAGFPYEETEDQQRAIEACLDDLARGRPMDRLICGDVGFGKTEVALRAAFVAALNGDQVAVVVPTTLLARQHYKIFSQRFARFPIKVAQLSRMVSASDARAVKKGLADGTVDIVVGTHAVLGKSVAFKNLGLVVIDEEQHFGVGHKERLKEMRSQTHVLTLSATPIPRTLQLAMTGVRDLSIIATPPVDRLAVRTFVTPFDELIVREALLRERYRGGQSFYVCPRIEDLDEAAAFLRQNAPEAKFVVAHGQMTPSELEEKMSAFYDGQYDVLLSTAIVESGLDIPTANTMIVHRADMFGLGQLYQLRGRVGRSKTRAWALFTIPAKRQITPQAEKRLKILQSLDTLGAGFQLASHDLDLRGAGNLLGEEQSGHIKEVGYELYQQMLTDAIDALKSGKEDVVEETWSPTINVGAPVTIPETYIEDLDLRLQLYRRLSAIENEQDIEPFGAEMIDRFGPLPPEVQQLLEIMAIKALARQAHIEKVEAGPKGATIAFRDNSFANPAGLVRFVAEQGARAKVRPDMKLVFSGEFGELEDVQSRLAGVRRLLRTLAAIARKKK